MGSTRRSLSARWWWMIPLLHGAAYALWARPSTATEGWIAGTFLLISAVASRALFIDPRPYSINRMYWIFHLVFFALVPSYQTAVNTFPWGSTGMTPPTILRANVLVLAGAGAYLLGRLITDAATEGRTPRVLGRVDEAYRRAHRWWGAGIFLLIAVAYIALAGVQNIWLKGELDYLLDGRVSDAVYLTVEKLVRGPVLYFALATIFLFRLRKVKRPFLAWVMLLFVVVNFPLTLPRSLLAACYVGVVLSFGGRLWQRFPQLFSLGLITLLLCVYPLAGITRWEAARATQKIEQPGAWLAASYTGGDFDAHASLCRVVERVRTRGTTKGKQLLTALAFPVPRKAWPQKSIGSGALVHREMNIEWTNVSCPLPAEGYINFGLLGTVLFSLLFAAGAHRYDAYYWQWRVHRAHLGDFSFPLLFYPVVLILAFFLLRGDLLSSLAAGVGLYVAGYFFHALLRIGLLRGRWFAP